MVHVRSLILAAVALVAAAGPAGADGKFFARPLVEEPSIAMQRGLVAWRDGIETLIVQSVVEGGGEEMGWIVPLPAPPTAIEACPPKTLERLAERVTPIVRHSAGQTLTAAFMFFVMAVLALAQTIANRGESPRDWKLRFLFYLAAISLVWALIPSLASSSGRGSQIDVLQSVSAGVYDIDVVRGESATAVQRWLAINGFAYSDEARPALEDYVARHWCFAAAKVRRENAGAIQHHPLRFVFPAEKAVYPMRLTGIGLRSLVLDLFVIGANEAVVDAMRPWVVQTLREATPWTYHDFVHTAAPSFCGDLSWIRVGMPDVSSLLWNGCVMTRLRGRLTRAQLDGDLSVAWRPAQPFVASLDSTERVAQHAATAGLFACSAGCIVTAVVVRKRGWSARTAAVRGLVPSAFAGLLACAAFWWITPAVKAGEPWAAWLSKRVSATQEDIIERLGREPAGAPFPIAYAQEIEKEIRQEEAEGTDYADQLREYTVSSDGEGWKLTISDDAYVPVTISIDSAGRPVRRGAGAGRAGD